MTRLLVGLIRLYQRFISPLLPPTCRYTPTCSSYFIEALRSRGPIVGTVKGCLRILRCNPFFAGGFDPVEPVEPADERTEKRTPPIESGEDSVGGV